MDSNREGTTMNGTALEIGTRVRLTHDIDRYPHFIADRGAEGTVSEWTNDLVAVRMDATVIGAEDWENEVHWYPVNGDDPLRDLEVI